MLKLPNNTTGNVFKWHRWWQRVLACILLLLGTPGRSVGNGAASAGVSHPLSRYPWRSSFLKEVHFCCMTVPLSLVGCRVWVYSYTFWVSAQACHPNKDRGTVIQHKWTSFRNLDLRGYLDRGWETPAEAAPLPTECPGVPSGRGMQARTLCHHLCHLKMFPVVLFGNFNILNWTTESDVVSVFVAPLLVPSRYINTLC